eukprot:g4165.t1
MRTRAFHYRHSWCRRRHILILVKCLFLCFLYFLAENLPTALAQENLADANVTRTNQDDINALLRIKAKMENSTKAFESLQTWTNDTDPCRDQWAHIQCTCRGLTNAFPNLIDYCANFTKTNGDQRIIFLSIPGGSEQNEKLTGRLPGAIGSLVKLRILDLSDNAFTGTIPRSFRHLRRLRYLNLAENRLNGTIPRFFGKYAKLQRMELGNNNFRGKIPKQICRDNIPPEEKVRIVLHENEGICGELPECLENIVNDLNGTYAYSDNIPGSRNESGVCDRTPPVCDVIKGCRIELPEYWNSTSYVEFNFTNFTDSESRVASHIVRLIRIPLSNAADTETEGISEGLTNIELTNLVPTNSVNVTEEIGNENITLVMNIVKHNLVTNGQLESGRSYNVSIEAQNYAGPPLRSEPILQGPVLVDIEAPLIETITIYNTLEFEDVPELTIGSKIGVSWNHRFIDRHSGLHYIMVQFQEELMDVNGSRIYKILEEHRDEKNLNTTVIPFTISEEDLEIGGKYRFKVIAYDKAGLDSSIVSNTFTVKKRNSHWFSGSNLGLVIGMAVLVFALGCLTAGVILPILRSHKRRLSFDRNEYLKTLTYKLIEASEDDLRTASEPILEQTEIAFVVTDVEASTQQSVANEAAFKQLTNIHDMIMRDTYDAYKGYEIQTEGDSFQLAFSSTASAVRFCLDVQRNFLDFKWGAEILRLPYCTLRKDVRGGVSFHGPRVRMAIHWAKETVVTNRVHPSTKHVIFEGPAFNVAKELCDNASGGQVLMTHDAWLDFLDQFPNTGFPTVEQLGCYKLQNWPEKMWIYHVTQRIGKPILRTFPCLRKVEAASEGAGMDIIPPPDPDDKGMLAFVALKSEPELKRMSLQMEKIYMELIRLHAQHFEGHLFHTDKETGIIVFAFGSSMNALRYCHIIQVSSVLQYWSSDHLSLCLPTIQNPTSSIPLFHGPRIAAAVHSTKRFETVYVQNVQTNANLWNSRFSGHGVTFVMHLVKVTNPGQIIFSGATWTPIQNSMPPESQCLSLGRHVIDDHYAHPVRLFELLPDDCEGREFPDLGTKRKIEPGHKPELVRKYEERREIRGVPESEIQALIAAYYESLTLFVAIVRHRLKTHGGYECKEPEMGKFTLAFHDLVSAIRWACHIHAELLRIDWPMKLLELEECKEKWHEGRILIHRGLGVKIGMAYGKCAEKKPLITGRADYFGSTANVAARVMALARPGQVLVQSNTGLDSTAVEWIDQNYGILKFENRLTLEVDGIEEIAVEISKLGMFLLRGVNELKVLYQAQPASVAVGGRFGEMDNASLYNSDTHKRSTVSRFWTGIRIRNPLKSAKDNLSCFLSQTNQNRPPSVVPSSAEGVNMFHGRLENSPHSASTNASTVQETSALLKSTSSKLPSSSRAAQSSGSGELLPGLNSTNPNDVVVVPIEMELVSARSSDSDPGQTEGSLFRNTNELMSSSRHNRTTMTRRIPSMSPQRNNNQEGKSTANTVQKLNSSNSDELVVSIGDQSIPRVRPVSMLIGPHESSDEEETQSPSQIGMTIASMYTNAGMAGASMDFSFPREVTAESVQNRGENTLRDPVESHHELEDEDDESSMMMKL